MESPLVYEDNTYHIDFEDLRTKTADPSVKVMLLCNPHNPAGRVWTRDELIRVAEICLENQVFVVSDEIHNEIVMPGYRYTPYGTLGEQFLLNSAICTSPSKSFNIAGLQNANITVANPDVRARVDRQININEVCDVNPFGVEALQAAYSPEGEQWLSELLPYLNANYQYLCQFFKERLPQFPVTRLEGTYLVWVNCAVLGMESQRLEEELVRKASVWFNAGDHYTFTSSPFLRINIACPRQTLQRALENFASYVASR